MVNLIGIDLGVHKLAMALFIEGELEDTTICEAHSPMRDRQLMELSHYALGWATLHDADAVWIEDVLLGNNHKYSLAIAEVKGALMGALSHLRPVTDIRTVNVQAWKKAVVGQGNATKDQVRDYIHVTHPVYAPLCDGDQDRYDATCVGLYGLQVTDRAKDLTLD